MNRRTCILALAALLATATPVPTAQASPRTPAGEVNAFFEEYRLAALGEIEEFPQEIRARTLSPPLNAELDRWSATHHRADPVFRSKKIPRSWSVRALTGTKVAVTETWYEDAGSQEVHFTVHRPDLEITAINDPPRTSH